MASNFVSIVCPSCKAPVEVDMKSKSGFCLYCRKPFACEETLKAPQYQNYQHYQNEKQQEGDDW